MAASTASTVITSASLRDRICALDDDGRKSVLHYLSGYAPKTLAAALDEIESQNAEGSDG